MIYRYLGSTIMIALLGFLALMGTPDAAATTAIGSVNAPSLLQFTSGGHALGFTQDSVYMGSRSNALRVEFVNARPTTPITAPTTGEAQRATPMTQVTYPGLWPGVTLTYDAPPGGILRSTYRIEPHADVSQIRLLYNAPVKVEANSELSLTCSAGVIHESPPVAWQEQDAGNKESIAVTFEQLGEREVGFRVGEYDPNRPLFIDPTLTWNTFLGGGQNNYGNGIAVDVEGNTYITGYSLQTWGSPIRPFTYAGYDAFVAKFDTSGNLIWNTFLGGNGHDQGQGVSLDEDGNIYVTGDSFTTWGSPVRAFTGSSNDAFVAKLDNNGNLIWNTFLGSSESEQGHGISVDGNGNVYVTGESYGTWGSPVNPYNNTNSDTFVAKLDINGNLIWNTFLGGGAGWGLAVAENGAVYVAGTILLAKLDSGGNLVWKQTPDGGSPVYGIRLDGNENVYITGFSLVTWGEPIRPYTYYDAFVARLDSGGSLTWNTFLGGSGGDVGHGISIDGNGNVYATGLSETSWGSPIRQFNGIGDAFVVKLDNNGNLLWNTFLGGSGADWGLGAAIDISKNVYVTGVSNSEWGSPILPHANIGNDAFVARLRGNFIISGYVRTSEGIGIGGVTMNGLPNIPETDSNGFYTVIVESGWSGSVTPVKAGYFFNPTSIGYSSVLTDRYDQNYTGTLIPLTISGDIRTPGGDGINGVMLTGIPGNPISNANGYFSGTIAYGWSGTVIPVIEGYSFNPSSRTYSSILNNQSDQDYTGSLIPLTISGYVRNSGGAGISGVTLNSLPGNPTTDGNGFYVGTADYSWSGMVTPTKIGYSFNPFSRSYSTLAANQSNQNYTSIQSTSTRVIPLYYVPTYPVPVTIEVVADPSKTVYVVEDSPPSGWTIKNISHNGFWDGSTKKVKWGPFYDQKNRSLSYEATPPWGESGTKTFFGEVSFDGINVQIGGSAAIDFQPISYHQADTNSDYRLLIDEITAYGAAWKTGQSWPISPSSIPINYMSNAGYIWKVSEIYHHDPGLTPPWVPSLIALGQNSMGVSVDASLFGSGTVSRQMQKYYLADVPVQVELSVIPDTGTQAYALEDSPPADWIISDINEDGGWDTVNKKVKWGPFFDNTSRVLAYKTTPPSGTVGIKVFSGKGSFDGTGVAIGGSSSVELQPEKIFYYLPLIIKD